MSPAEAGATPLIGSRCAQAKGEQTLKGEDEFKFRTNERKRH